MLFALTWRPTPGLSSEDRGQNARCSCLQSGPAPSGFEFKGFYDYADGDGGIAIVETSSAEATLEAVAPWATFFRFQMRPIVPADKAAAIYQKSVAWRDTERRVCRRPPASRGRWTLS